MVEALTIRPMVATDVPEVLNTLRAALGETALLKRTPQQWEWKHTLNPFGESIVLVAADDDRIAAVRAFMRWRLATPDGGELSCVRAVDTAVHPDFQRRGLFAPSTSPPSRSPAPMGWISCSTPPTANPGPVTSSRVGATLARSG